MTTLGFRASTAPADIVAALGMVAPVVYSVQNISAPPATLYVREGGPVPDAAAPAWRVESGGDLPLRYDGAPIWVWTDDAGGCPVILREAA